MARVGKIAQLPAEIRAELNRRLLDGQPGTVILPWVNGLPEVQAILKERFGGAAINDPNLSDWRNGGYQDWLRRREKLDRTRELSTYATELAQANGGSIASGGAAIASGLLLELMESCAGEEGGKMSPEEVGEVVKALNDLRAGDQNDEKLRLERLKVAQKDQALALDRQKFQRLTCAMFIKWSENEAAKRIVTGSESNDAKTEALGALMFGEDWK